MNFMFFFNSILLGVGLAMDAFSVSLANGLHEPFMKKRKMTLVAATFALFQFLMPLMGYFCVCSIAGIFGAFQKFIPYIALVLLLYIGGKMLLEGIQEKDPCKENPALGFYALVVQGIATSIDALSVGFTIAEHTAPMALLCAAIIAAVTFGICYFGIVIGKKAGTHLAGKAGIFGGAILIFIGIEIFVTGVM